jgi:LmbE family N-acetylglucosaminyl deacetylase
MSGVALRLMAVLAHPDDESLGLGGLLAAMAAERVEVAIVTATRGEGGRYLEHRSGPEHPGREKLAEIREAELRCAAEVLGVTDVSILGLADGRVDQAPARETIARIATHYRRFRPQVVVTFAADGAYGHPDHVAMSQFATAAIVTAADAAQALSERGVPLPPHAVAKLYYTVANPDDWEIYQRVFKKLTTTVDGIERAAVPWPDWAITTAVDVRAHWRKAWEAVQCHRSQIASYGGLETLPPEVHEQLWGTEHLYRALSTVNGGRTRETDVFAGLR